MPASVPLGTSQHLFDHPPALCSPSPQARPLNLRSVSDGGAAEQAPGSVSTTDTDRGTVPRSSAPAGESGGSTLKVAAVGEVGELVVFGRCLAEGYWRQPELTAARFPQLRRAADGGSYTVVGPTGPEAADGAETARAFLTGDMGYRDEAGDLHYLGMPLPVGCAEGSLPHLSSIGGGGLGSPPPRDTAPPLISDWAKFSSAPLKTQYRVGGVWTHPPTPPRPPPLKGAPGPHCGPHRHGTKCHCWHRLSNRPTADGCGWGGRGRAALEGEELLKVAVASGR